VAIAQNLFSKSYLQGVSDLFEALLMSSTDPAGSIGPMERYLTRQAASVVPYTSLLSAVERQVDPTLRSAFTVVDEIRSRTPGFSEDLPPRRNMFGEPIVLEGGIGPDIMSPVYVSSDKKDRVADELVLQQAGIRMPRKTIGDYELDAWEYDRYTQLAAGIDRPDSAPTLKQALRELMDGGDYKAGTNGPDGSKALQIQMLVEGYRREAKIFMLEEFPEINAAVEMQQRLKIQKLGY